jgi:hypothetical protein
VDTAGIHALSPEVRLLLDLARPRARQDELHPAADLLSSCAQSFDWAQFIELASANRVLPLVWQRIRDSGLHRIRIGDVPAIAPPHIETFSCCYEASWLRNREFLTVSREICEVLQGVAIACVTRKGVGVAYSAYDDPATRMMSNVNVLIHRKNAADAFQVLRSVGYREESISPEMRSALLFSPRLGTLRRKVESASVRSSLYVEISAEIFPRRTGYSYPTDEVLQTIDRVELAGEIVNILPLDLMLIDVGAHFYEDLKSVTGILYSKDLTLAKCCDIVGIASQFSEQCWVDFVDRVCGHGLQVPMYAALAIADEIYSGTIPEVVLTSIKPDHFDLHSYGEVDSRVSRWAEENLLKRLLDQRRRWYPTDRSRIARLI